MRDRAPDNMPTETLRGMVAYAEEQCSDWTERMNHHYRMYENAQSAYAEWERSVIDLQKQLDNRLADEAQPHIPYLDN